MAYCTICGGRANKRDVCDRCKKEYGLGQSVETWPEWARELNNLEKTWRNKEKRPADAAELDTRDNPGIQLDELGRPYGTEEHTYYKHNTRSGPIFAEWLMRYAPYNEQNSPGDYEERNRIYRASCGIKERKDPRRNDDVIIKIITHEAIISPHDNTDRLDDVEASREILDGLNPRQSAIVENVNKVSTQTELARILNVSQPAAYKRIETTGRAISSGSAFTVHRPTEDAMRLALDRSDGWQPEPLWHERMTRTAGAIPGKVHGQPLWLFLQSVGELYDKLLRYRADAIPKRILVIRLTESPKRL